MQVANDNIEAERSGKKRSRVALALKIALGQTNLSETIGDDERCQGFFDLGFEIGSEGGIGDVLAMMQGALQGLEQFIADSERQGRLDLE